MTTQDLLEKIPIVLNNPLEAAKEATIYRSIKYKERIEAPGWQVL